MNVLIPTEPIPGLDFVAIDFETANRHRRSACSLGLAIVRNGVVVETKNWLIKPDPFEVDFFNQKIHGISKEMLVNSPDFSELWPEVEPFLSNEVIVAHNASFDIDVLSKAADHYNLDLSYRFDFCTHQAIPWCWPEIGSTKLKDVAKFLNIDLDHHNAVSDATAAAQIAISMARLKKTTDLSNIIPSYYHKSPISVIEKSQMPKRDFWNVAPAIADISGLEFSNASFNEIDWVEKRVCITGTFTKFPERDHLIEKIVQLGAKQQSSINSKTQVAIIGNNAGPSKIKTVKELIAKGAEILLFNDDHVNGTNW